MQAMKHLCAIVLAGLALAGPANSQSSFWRDSTGRHVPETESMRSKSDFAGSLLATTDEDWERKWNTPPETKPSFNQAGVVAFGKKVFILSFIGNPKLDALGNANVLCDFKISDPAGKSAVSQKNVKCFVGRLKGNPYNLYLSDAVLTFAGDPGDRPGTWVVEVNLRDVNRQVDLPLRTSFQLK